MNLIFFGIVAGVVVWVVSLIRDFTIFWRSEGVKLEDAQRTLTPEFEQAVRRHPSSRPKPMGVDDWGNTEPTILTGRFVYDDSEPTEQERADIRAYLAEHGPRMRSNVFDQIREKGERA